jgi:hypothetical protein
MRYPSLLTSTSPGAYLLADLRWVAADAQTHRAVAARSELEDLVLDLNQRLAVAHRLASPGRVGG